MPVIERIAKMAIEAGEVKRYPWVAFCEEPNCYFIVSAKNVRQGNESLLQHKCPHGGSSDRMPDKPLISAMWRELDACTDALMLHKTHHDPIWAKDSKAEYYKGRAQGIATCLFILLGGAPGYYLTQDDITREAVRRYKMRVGELEWEPTQGDNYDALRDGATPRWVEVVNQLKARGTASRESIDPKPNRSTTVPRPRKPTTRARSTTPQALVAPPPMPGVIPPSAPVVPSVPMAAPGATLPPDVENGIKHGLKSGLFNHQELAAMYGVSVSVVAALES